MLNEYHTRFIKEIEKAAVSHYVNDVFADAVHMMACSIWAPLSPDPKAVEADFDATRKKYKDSEYEHLQVAFGIVMEALEHRREEFLGAILEHLNANAKGFGQFLTPQPIARLMGRMAMDGIQYEPGKILTITDPACGASVLMIEQAEIMMQELNVSQGDIYIMVGDIDRRAVDMSYIELSLLGYAACVEHMDSLQMKRFSEPRYSPGYFLHCMPMRLPSQRRKPESLDAADGETAGDSDETPTAEEKQKQVFSIPKSTGGAVQLELF